MSFNKVRRRVAHHVLAVRSVKGADLCSKQSIEATVLSGAGLYSRSAANHMHLSGLFSSTNYSWTIEPRNSVPRRKHDV